MSSEIWGIVIGVLLTVGTGFFVASEFALVNLNRSDLERRQAQGEKGLRLTISALRVTSTHLSSAQLGITLTTLLAGFTFEPAISSLLRAPLSGIGLPEAVIPGVGAVVAITLATLFSMIIGELVPKNFALAVPLATAKIVVPFQLAFTFVLKPVILFFNGTANRVIRSFGIEPKEELSAARSAEELGYLIRRSATEGLLDANDADILHRTLTFSTRTADAVMTPRVRVVALPSTASVQDVIDASIESGHSRFPVYGDDIDDIIGIAHVKAAFAIDDERRASAPVKSITSKMLRVPESAGSDTLLGALRDRGYQIAVVVDEHGGTAGVVTLEDLIEELLGELLDEHDDPSILSEDIIPDGDSVLFNAALRPDELWSRARIRVPEDEEYDTVAGFFLTMLERIPEVGETVEIADGTLEVEAVSGARIERLRFTPPPAEPGAADAAEPTATTTEHAR
ncbi:hypothetical protein ACIFOC_00228 [Leucobacter aridicollis]|uniref:hemolysin family protein n=1 Tax=Leucobacter aridicollis TaxID=283878 RepID=UPI0037CA22E6